MYVSFYCYFLIEAMNKVIHAHTCLSLSYTDIELYMSQRNFGTHTHTVKDCR
jgi:transposase-like protein